MNDPHDPADDDTHIVEVYAAANEIDAGAIRAALDEAGIRSRLVGNLLGNTFSIPIGIGDPKIVVREEDALAARRVIEQLQDQMGADYDDPNLKTDPFDEPADDGE
ncbi:MAG: DUF2007 domain-containing protein [Planctomycetota bacterium]|nr:DUF2007 domain-containing protein [Planctomycetota bacterium]